MNESSLRLTRVSAPLTPLAGPILSWCISKFYLFLRDDFFQMCFRKCRKSSVFPPSHNSFCYTKKLLTLTSQGLLNAPKLYTSLFENEKLFPRKMERYSSVFVYVHDADVCHKIFVPAWRVKPTNSTQWATFRERRTGWTLRIGLYARD